MLQLLLEASHVDLPSFVVVNDALWVICSNDATTLLLDVLWRLPGFKQVSFGIGGKLGNKMPNILFGVRMLR